MEELILIFRHCYFQRRSIQASLLDAGIAVCEGPGSSLPWGELYLSTEYLDN